MIITGWPSCDNHRYSSTIVDIVPITLKQTIETDVLFIGDNHRMAETRIPQDGEEETIHKEMSIMPSYNYLPVILGNIPLPLRKFNQWVYWKAVEKVKGEKPAKIPFMVDGNTAKVNDPSTCCDWRQIELKHPDKIGMTGIGFVLTENDPFVMIDLDNCVSEGNPNEYALKVIEYFDSYTEISPSATGIRIVIKGELKKALKKTEIEIYSELRYMALTGHRWGGEFRGIEKRQDLLDRVIKKHAEPDKPRKKVDRKTNGVFRIPREQIREGNRNNRLAYWAGVIVGKGVSEQDYYNCLHAVNEKCCQPPLPEAEVTAIGKSIWRYNA